MSVKCRLKRVPLFWTIFHDKMTKTHDKMSRGPVTDVWDIFMYFGQNLPKIYIHIYVSLIIDDIFNNMNCECIYDYNDYNDYMTTMTI